MLNSSPLHPAFERSAMVYDAVYAQRGKDYAGEVEYLLKVIVDQSGQNQLRLLDVACGTGQHLRHFIEHKGIQGTGLDRCPAMLEAAHNTLSHVSLHEGDMSNFSLDASFDIITCLFASIAYLPNEETMHQAVACMARHLAAEGILLIEPGVMPESFQPPQRDETFVALPGGIVRRVTTAQREGQVLIITFEFEVTNGAAIHCFREEHRVQLFERASYERAFRTAGLEVEFDPLGPAGRGLFIGIHADQARKRQSN